MSKVANMLNMIQILKDGKIHNMKEIAKQIEVSPRMIKQYKNELEQAGIYIESRRGLYGGYMINHELNNIDIGLTYNELKKLDEVGKKNSNEEIKKIIEKVCNSYNKNIRKNNLKKFERIRSDKNDLKNIYISMRKAINEKKKVYIKYFSNDSGMNDRIIHPAEMFYYLNEWYVAAFCERKNAIRLFKINDIQEYRILKQKYENFEIKR